MSSRTWGRAAGAAILLAATVPAPAARADPRSPRLSAYLEIVERSRAGNTKRAVDELWLWPLEDVRSVVEEVTREPGRLSACPDQPGTIPAVAVEAAALLHVEVAVVSPSDPARTTFLLHVKLAEELLEFVRKATRGWDKAAPLGAPRPTCAYSPRVSRRDFYAVMAGLLLARGHPRLALRASSRGRDDVSDDAWLLLAAGCAHEQLSLVLGQYLSAPFLSPLPLNERLLSDRRRQSRIRQLEEERQLAQDLFRRALAHPPEMDAAHLRLGRLLAQEGRRDEAERELRAAAASEDPETRYLAELFLGGLEEQRSNPTGAESRYRRALDTVPQAQAARLALAHLEGLTGRHDSARSLVLAALRTPGPRELAADPWWNYPGGPWTDSQHLLLELHDRVRSP